MEKKLSQEATDLRFSKTAPIALEYGLGQACLGKVTIPSNSGKERKRYVHGIC